MYITKHCVRDESFFILIFQLKSCKDNNHNTATTAEIQKKEYWLKDTLIRLSIFYDQLKEEKMEIDRNRIIWESSHGNQTISTNC